MRSARRLVPLLALSPILFVAGFWRAAAQSVSPAPVAYRISVAEPHKRLLDVEVTFPEVTAPLEIRMSRFSPGRYSAHEFERNVFDMRATTGSGRTIALDHPAPWAWRAVTDDGLVRVRYKVYGDRVDGTYVAVDASHAHINTPAALVWAEGYEWRPATITCVPPAGSGWRVATQLLSGAGENPAEAGSHEEQAGSHEEQTGSHEDQAGSHEDQAGSHGDQAGSHRDQAGSHEDHAGSHGGQDGSGKRHAFVFTAPNFQYLADSPIEMSRHVTRTFHAPLPGGAAGPAPTIELSLHHTGSNADADAFAADLRRIVGEAAAVFGEYPAYEGGRYTFLADYLPWAVGDGMEHRNSTVLTSSQALGDSRARLIGTAAHEFFHGWNVERIRPRSLEPFDFERPNISGELWLAEGVTSYYEDLLVHRAGLSSLDETLRGMGSAVNEVITSPSHRFHSAADMSRMALLVDGTRGLARTNLNNTFVSYYTYGAALGLGLDLAIRAHTGGSRSLDDLMAALWRDFGRTPPPRPGTVATPYTIDDVTGRLGAVLGDSTLARTWIARYIEGRDVMDYGTLLAPAGLRLRKANAGRASLGLASFDQGSQTLRLGAPAPLGSPLEAAGLGEDDELLALNGKTLGDYAALESALGRVRPGDTITLQVRRRGTAAPEAVKVRTIEDPRVEIVTVESTGGHLTDDERRFRERWLHSRIRTPEFGVRN